MDAPTDAGPTAGAPPPPGPPAGRPGPRRLQRRPDEGHIAGVCAGVAEYFNVDPVIVRIAAVVLLFSGPGAVAYVLAWIFVPEAEGPVDHGASQRPIDRMDRGTQIFGIVLLFLAGSLFWGDWWSPAKRWLFPLGLMALGAWLLLRRDRDDDEPDPSEPPTPAAPSAWAPAPAAVTASAPTPAGPDDTVPHEDGDPTVGASAEPGDTATITDAVAATDADAVPDVGEVADVGRGDGSGEPPVPPWSPPGGGGPPGGHHLDRGHDHLHHRHRRHRRVLGPIMCGALLIWAGLAFLTDVSLETGLAGATLILGIGFVLGSFVGGSRGLIVPALVVATALAATAAIDIPLSGPVGTRTWSPQRIADVDDTYEVSMGEGTLDLSAIALRTGRTLTVDASVGMGHLVVLLPDAMTAEITTDVGAGESRVFGAVQDGLGVATDQRYDGDPGSGTLELYLQVGLGKVEVHRVAGDAPATTTSTTILG